ncbi:hypothetical protein SDC9_69782 [bioreactor metagenome]|uniref:Flagellar M-ring N-terminal domain-containing protein n=1 Tax=bioreactor metagenome TaxID=1076179 RepID=A0A644Y5T2_9ZZZZ
MMGSSAMTISKCLRLALACLCMTLAACGARVDLMGSIPEDEANDVLSALLKESISAEKTSGKEGMVGVRVNADQVGRALEILRANGLPRERFAGMGQVFKKDGLISSPVEERARYIYALSQELGNTLSKIDGVLTARVHVVLPERGAVGEAGTPSTAAVFIKHQDGYNLEIIQPQIRKLVTNSIPGLTTDRVSVIFVASQAREQADESKASEQHAQVWGMDVSRANAATLSTVLWSLVALLVAALAAVGFLAWKYALPRKPDTAAVSATAPAA